MVGLSGRQQPWECILEKLLSILLSFIWSTVISVAFFLFFFCFVFVMCLHYHEDLRICQSHGANELRTKYFEIMSQNKSFLFLSCYVRCFVRGLHQPSTHKQYKSEVIAEISLPTWFWAFGTSLYK